MLIEFEESDEKLFLAIPTMDEDAEDAKKYYHAKLLCDAGMLEEVNRGVFRMTSHGHDYVETIKSDTIWKKTKKISASAGSTTIGIMYEIAVSLAKKEISARLGVSI